MDALDVGEFLYRLEGNNHHNGGAVRVGYYASRTHESILGIAFRHYERHIFIHTEGAGIVNHHGSVLGDGFGKLLRGAGSCGYEGVVHALEIVIVLQKAYGVRLPAEVINGARASLRAEKKQFVNREVPLFKHFKQFLTYGATCANNCYSHIFFFKC